MTISGEPCPVCGLNCEADVKRVWPDAYAYPKMTNIGIYIPMVAGGVPSCIEIGAGESHLRAWHSTAQRPEVKAAREEYQRKAWEDYRRETAHAYSDATTPGFFVAPERPNFPEPEAMRKAGKAAEPIHTSGYMQRVGASSCVRCAFKTDAAMSFENQDAAMMEHLALAHPDWQTEPLVRYVQPVEGGPQPNSHRGDFDNTLGVPPAPERGEPKGVEDLLFDRMGGQYFNWDEINRRIREAEKIGEARGFNACREMAARLIHRMVVGFEATKVTAPLVTPFKEIEEAIRNLKQPEGK